MSLSAAVGSWDIYVSSLFYDGGHFLLEDNFLGNLIRRGIPELIVLSAAVIFAVWLYGKISCRVCGGIDNRVVLLTSGTMLVGPFLIVNGIFKTFWGRARPRDIDLFGGSKAFSLPLEISNQCAWDCSFMSGHTAVAFWLLAPALLAPKKFRFFAVAAALLFGVTTAVFRIGQGAHFFSDVAFSALVMCLLIVAVYRWLS